MSDIVIFLKILLSLILLLTTISVFALIKANKFLVTIKKLYLLLVLSRLSIFFFVYIIIALEAQSDVQAFYYSQAKNVLAGLLPYIDFQSSYSFFFPYICAMVLLVWDSAKSIILLSIFIELLSFITWREIFVKLNIKVLDVEQSSLIYIFNPLPLMLTTISGQNQIWLSLFIALSILLILRNRSLLGGFVFATGFLVTKFLIFFFLPILLLFTKSRTKYILGFVLPILFYVALSFILKFDLLLPLHEESVNISSGNLYYLFSLVSLNSLPTLFWDISVLAIITSSFLLIWKKFDNSNSLNILLVIVLVFILFLLINKKSYTNYLVIIFQPLTYLYFLNEITKRKIFIFWLFSTIAAIEPTLWFRIMDNHGLNIIWKINNYNISLIDAISFIIIELLLIFFYIYLIASFNRIRYRT